MKCFTLQAIYSTRADASNGADRHTSLSRQARPRQSPPLGHCDAPATAPYLSAPRAAVAPRRAKRGACPVPAPTSGAVALWQSSRTNHRTLPRRGQRLNEARASCRGLAAPGRRDCLPDNPSRPSTPAPQWHQAVREKSRRCADVRQPIQPGHDSCGLRWPPHE